MANDVIAHATTSPLMYWRQLLRFSIVGLSANAIGYLLYAGLTYLGLSPQATVGILYPIGALLGYLGNKRLTFGHRGGWWSSGWRYLLVQLIGMGMNLLMLWLFVDVAGVNHHWVQAAAILVVAAYLFVAMRWYVFAPRSARP
ncbi:GtrA family protein [uncultured Hydrogenophaga sp.]|jgi:putative flippase GtrA|uniref:GtrA family protein n=1 Tax=uncultured Hydrogenophaga sp. TaxID=199683 RepID=UPI0025873772|nr:GtrA family protein [uncultured Hydrogenophaga sp.]